LVANWAIKHVTARCIIDKGVLTISSGAAGYCLGILVDVILKRKFVELIL